VKRQFHFISGLGLGARFSANAAALVALRGLGEKVNCGIGEVGGSGSLIRPWSSSTL